MIKEKCFILCQSVDFVYLADYEVLCSFALHSFKEEGEKVKGHKWDFRYMCHLKQRTSLHILSLPACKLHQEPAGYGDFTFSKSIHPPEAEGRNFQKVRNYGRSSD